MAQAPLENRPAVPAPFHLGTVWSLIAAATGGFLLDVATPQIELWPAAFVGIILILIAIWQQRTRRGLALGLVAGAAFWFPHIFWLTLYLGPIPWLALGTVMTAWFGAMGALIAWGTRGLARLPVSALAVSLVQAVTVSGIWLLREQVQSSWPYGGFAWGRIAHTQARSPFAELVSWIGFTGLSAFVVFVCAAAVALGFGLLRPYGAPVRPRGAAVAAGAVALVVGLAAAIPVAALPQTGSLRVAAVQGNSKSGIFDDRDNGDVLREHLAVTEQLLDDLERAEESVDVIVWPENSAEFSFPENEVGGLQLAHLSDRANAPIIIGSVLPRDGGLYTNSSLVWGPEGEVESEAGEPLHYDKRYPVPFAEYMPHRSFYHSLVPELVDLVQLEYEVGTLPAAFAVPGVSGEFTAGLAICFDIIFDRQAHAMVDDGAEVIVAQTNNADFGDTDQSAQQLQIAHLRAIETGRSLVNVSTVGTSAVVLPDGTEVDRLAPHTPDYLLAEVPLVSGATPALRFGSAITVVWGLLGAAGLGLAILAERRSASGYSLFAFRFRRSAPTLSKKL